MKLVGAKIICQQLYDQAESKQVLQLSLQLKAQELYQKSTGEFVSFVAGRKILEQRNICNECGSKIGTFEVSCDSDWAH